MTVETHNHPSPSPEPVDDTSELRTIQEQVAQAREILSDAIRKVASNFRILDHQTASQKVLIQEILDVMSSKTAHRGGLTESHISVQAFARETSEVMHQFTDLLGTVSTQSERTMHRIDDMARELDAVFKLVASINEISEETFILAVNATIEAAHADGGGRSFSVIAANVRELSKKTRRFNEQIESQIVKARQAVEEVREAIGDLASRDLQVALAGKERLQTMLGQLQAFEQLVGDSLDKATGQTTRICSAADEAVAALQCEDVLMDILESVEARIAWLRNGGSKGTTPRPAPRAGRGTRTVKTLLETLRQGSMQPGDATFF